MRWVSIPLGPTFVMKPQQRWDILISGRLWTQLWVCSTNVFSFGYKFVDCLSIDTDMLYVLYKKYLRVLSNIISTSIRTDDGESRFYFWNEFGRTPIPWQHPLPLPQIREMRKKGELKSACNLIIPSLIRNFQPLKPLDILKWLFIYDLSCVCSDKTVIVPDQFGAAIIESVF